MLVPSSVSDSGTFVRFCMHPALLGKGALEGSAKCTVKYPKKTREKQAAVEFCTKVSPYPISSSKEGSPTTCVYQKEYTCDDHEEEIFDHCFVVKPPNGEPFSRAACPEGYSLHVVTTKDEMKWATVLYDSIYSGLWIGNTESSAGFLRPQEPYKPRKRDTAKDTGKEERPIFFRLKDGYRDKTKRGRSYYGQPKMQLPYLCSREADAFEETIENDGEFLKALGFDVFSVTDKDGRKRFYVSFNKMFAVKSSKYEADFSELHKVCSVVRGHVATREDFEKEEDYQKVLSRVIDLYFP
ncbi:hypothetical protein Aduo_007404 [Ancylostoma duodenale]